MLHIFEIVLLMHIFWCIRQSQTFFLFFPSQKGVFNFRNSKRPDINICPKNSKKVTILKIGSLEVFERGCPTLNCVPLPTSSPQILLSQSEQTERQRDRETKRQRDNKNINFYLFVLQRTHSLMTIKPQSFNTKTILIDIFLFK